MTLTRFAPADAGAAAPLARLIERTLRTSNAADYPPEYLDGIVRGYSAEALVHLASDIHLYALWEDGQPVACGGVSPADRGVCTLQAIFVAPECQGRGLGRRIVAALEADAFARQARRIDLHASITAVGFYERLGYACAAGSAVVEADGCVRMEKRRDCAWGLREK